MKWMARIAGSVAVLLVFALLGLWIASNRGDAGRMRGSIEIARPPEDIWPWITEPDRLTQWVGWLAEVRPDSTAPATGIGHRVTWIMDDPRLKQRLSVPGVVTLWEPPLQMGVHIEVPGKFVGDVLYKLTDLGNGRTRVEQDGRMRYLERFAALMEPMITPEAMRKMFDDMHRLRTKVEAVPFEPGEEPGADADSVGADLPADSTTG